MKWPACGCPNPWNPWCPGHICHYRVWATINAIVENLYIDFGVHISPNEDYMIKEITQFDINLSEMKIVDFNVDFDVGSIIIDWFLEQATGLLTKGFVILLPEIEPKLKGFLNKFLVGKTFEDLGINIR